MKAKYTLLLALLTATGFAADQRIGLEQAPAAVQRAIESSRDLGPVKKITQRTENDRVVYDVEFEKKNAINPKLRLAEDGTVLSDSRRPAAVDYVGNPVVSPDGVVPVPVIERLRLEDLPSAVQATAQREASGREIVDIDQETWNGRRVYEIEFRQAGLNAQVHVAEDGTVLKDENRPKGLKQWFKGTQLNETPRAVQDTIQREVGERQIADIDRKLRTGQPVYEVQVRDNMGSFQLEIAADGSVINDSRKR